MQDNRQGSGRERPTCMDSTLYGVPKAVAVDMNGINSMPPKGQTLSVSGYEVFDLYSICVFVFVKFSFSGLLNA